ncbi:MAG: M23 family metallopeptidase [Myxococcales bacterium]|nr:M23 family metallopeptidase [Myxococcales bacterium]
MDGVRLLVTPSLVLIVCLLGVKVAEGAPDDRWPPRPPAYGDLLAPMQLREVGDPGVEGPSKRRRVPNKATPRPADSDSPRRMCDVDRAKRAGISVRNVVLRSNDSPWKVMRRLQVGRRDRVRVARSFRTLVRFKKRAPGYSMRVAINGRGQLAWLRLKIGIQNAFCARRANDDSFAVVTQVLSMDTRLEKIEGLLLGRWSDALEAAGEARALGILAASLFPRYDDTTQERESEGLAKLTSLGAWVPVFRMIVEKRYVEGELVGYGALEAIELDNGQSVKSIFRFPQAGNKHAFYNERGRPVRPERLRTPVLDAPMTSGFGFRIHPVKKERRMHNGIDYGAPMGSPIFAVETGVVTHAGELGTYGRAVAIRHPDGLITRYCHMRDVATGLIPGDTVESGDLIGYVGSTGLSSGPHLHLETIKKGRFLDPLKYKPPAPKRLRGNERKQFLRKAGQLRNRLDGKLVS